MRRDGGRSFVHAASSWDELSAGATLVPRVKNAVQRLAISECEKLVEEVLELDTPSAVLARCTAMAEKNYPELIA